MMQKPSLIGMAASERPPGSAKVFVGQIGKGTVESDVKELLEPFGEVLEVAMMRDKITGESKAAENAIRALHNNHTMPSWRSPLQLSFAKGEEERVDAKLFVGGISRDADESQIQDIFRSCGEVQEVFIMRDRATGGSKGCAFVKFGTQGEAKRAIDTISGKCTMQGASEPLVVKWAENKDQARGGPGGPGGPIGPMGMSRGDRDRESGWDRGHGGGMPPVGRGGWGAPPGGMTPPPQNGWGAQNGAGGFPSYPPSQGPPQQQQYGQPAPYGQQPPYSQQQPGQSQYGQQQQYGQQAQQYGQQAQQYNQPAQGQYGQPAGQYGQPAGQYGQAAGQYGQPAAPQYGAQAPQYGAAADPYAANADPNLYGQSQQQGNYGYGQQHAAPAMPGGGHGGGAFPQAGGFQAGGGMGGPARSQNNEANLFIFNIPSSWSDSELGSNFGPFGNVLSATVFKDKATGEHKGYGFVSYDNGASAQQAISAMNGLQVDGKRLKVEIKKPRTNPYGQ